MHEIEKAVFDISFGAEETAYEEQGELGDFIRRRLMPVVDEVFDNFADGKFLKIDSLEIDLGEFVYADYQDEMVERLKERLERHLRDKFHDFSVVSKEEQELAWLEHFLLTGHLPWNPKAMGGGFEKTLRNALENNWGNFLLMLKRAPHRQAVLQRIATQLSQGTLGEIFRRLPSEQGASDAEALKSLSRRLADAFMRGSDHALLGIWGNLVKEHPELLKEHIQRYGRQPGPRRRIAENYSEVLLKDMVHLLEPVHSGFIEEIISNPMLLQRVLEEKASLSKGKKKVKRQLWEFTLAYLLVERGSRFNKKTYIESLLRQMAARSASRYEEVLQSLIEVLGSTGEKSLIKTGMLQILLELQQAETGGEQSESVSEAPGALRLREVLERADETALTEIWKEFENNPAPLREALIRFGQKAQGGRQITERFSESWIQEMVVLLEPEHSGFIDEIAQNPDLFQKARQGSVGREQLKKEVWEFTLNFLFVDRGGWFNKKDFLAGLLRQMAARDNNRYEDLLQSLKTVLRQIGEAGSHIRLSSQMLALLDELETETVGTPSSPSKRSWKVLGQWDGPTEETLKAVLAKDQDSFITEVIGKDELFRSVGERGGQGGQRLKNQFWEFSLGFLLEERGSFFNTKAYLESVLRKMAVRDNCRYEDLLISFLVVLENTGGQSPVKAGMLRVLGALVEEGDSQEAEGSAASSGGERLEAREVRAPEEEEEEFAEEIYIENAGLVLAAPYIPRLFSMLELTEKSQFKDRSCVERAVHLLQYMVDGSTDSPEYKLVLNKLLCGLRTGVPLDKRIDIGQRERETVEGLINAMIQNWKSLGKTSVQGFRESFLQREARLLLKDDEWQLLVQAKPFDMLLDQIPWSFRTIKHPWMERVVYVDWR